MSELTAAKGEKTLMPNSIKKTIIAPSDNMHLNLSTVRKITRSIILPFLYHNAVE